MATKGSGLGADLVNHSLKENGEGLTGIVLGTEDIKQTKDHISRQGYKLGTSSEGQGEDSENGKLRNWNNLFLPQELTRGIFSFVIEHTKGKLDK